MLRVTLPDLPSVTPSTPDTLLWKDTALNVHGYRLHKIRIRAGNGNGLRVGLMTGESANDVHFIATATSAALVAINDIQMLHTELAYDVTGPYRVAQQDIGEHRPRIIPISIYEKSGTADIIGLSLSVMSRRAKVDFRDVSLSQPLADFFREHSDLFRELDRMYGRPGVSPSLSNSRARAEQVIANYILQYLINEHRISTPDYERLAHAPTSGLFSDNVTPLGSDEALFSRFVSLINPEKFIRYLKETKFPAEAAQVPSVPEDKAQVDTIREFRQWLPERISRGVHTLRIDSIPSGQKLEIQALAAFPDGARAGQPTPAIVASWSSAGGTSQTIIELPIEVYDRYSWLKVLLKYLAIALFGAVLGAIVKWLFDMFAAPRFVKSFTAEIREGAYEIILPDADGSPGRIELSGTLLITNRVSQPRAIRCESCKLVIGAGSEELSPLRFRTADLAQFTEVVNLDSNRAVQVTISSSREYRDALPECVRGCRRGRLVITLGEVSGKSARVTADIERKDTVMPLAAAHREGV